MHPNDSLQSFLFEKAHIRGQIVRLEKTCEDILNQHPYPPVVRKLLAEAMLSCALLAGTIKFEGELSLQFQGDKTLPLLLVQCDHLLNMRAFAQYAPDCKDAAYQAAFLQGTMALTINQYQQTQIYQSMVPLDSASMADNLMHYFAKSEQIPTRVWLATRDNNAAGMLLQLMPGGDFTQREQFWEYAVVMGETVSEEELLGIDNTTLLYRLYHETELRLFDSKTVRFRCRCSEDKMKQVVRVLGEAEANSLLAEKGTVDVRCDFCNKAFRFDSIDIALLFRSQMLS